MTEVRTDYGSIRRKLHEAINDTVLEHTDGVTGVTGWILIYETAMGQESRDFTAISGDIIGESDLPVWTARGWLDEISEDIYAYLGVGSEEWDGEED